MKRRGFLGALAGAVTAGAVAKKAAEAPKVKEIIWERGLSDDDWSAGRPMPATRDADGNLEVRLPPKGTGDWSEIMTIRIENDISRLVG